MNVTCSISISEPGGENIQHWLADSRNHWNLLPIDYNPCCNNIC